MITSSKIDNKELQFIGSKELFYNQKIALFCSNKCPGSIIIKSFDLMQELRELDITLISGFHTPVEKECLEILLKGKCGIIVAPARSIEKMRIPKDWKNHIDNQRLLITSPFPSKINRATKDTSTIRNNFILSHADKILILHASQNSNTYQLAIDQSKTHKKLFTIDELANIHLIELGYRPLNLNEL